MSRPLEVQGRAGRAATGIAQLDPLIDGGFPLHRAIVVCGPAGSGKTILGLQFLRAGLDRGEAGVFVAADQKPRHLIEDAGGFGWDVQADIARNRLAVFDASPYFTAMRGRGGRDVDARRIAADLTRAVRTIDAHRLVVDTITSLVPAGATPHEVDDYLRTLIHALEDNLGCTILLTCRAPDAQPCCRAARYLASGIIELGMAGSTGAGRTLRVVKMRATCVDLAPHAVTIAPALGLALDLSAASRLRAHTAAATG